MARIAEALSFVIPEAELVRIPAWDCLPYDRVSPNPALVSERVASLGRLLEPAPQPRIVLTTVNALVQRVPPRAGFRGASLELRVNGDLQAKELARFLEANGYGRANTVMEPGEYAMRGGIIDIFPAGEPEPIRIDLFGDTIETIRAFDPATQRSAGKRQRLTLRPVSEVPLDKEFGRSFPHRLARDLRPGGRRATRSITRSRTAGAIPASSTMRRCSIRGWRRCSTTCPAPPSASIIRPRTRWSRAWR